MVFSHILISSPQLCSSFDHIMMQDRDSRVPEQPNNPPAGSLPSSFFGPLFGKLLSLFRIPYIFIRNPFSLHLFVSETDCRSKLVVSVFELALLQFFLFNYFLQGTFSDIREMTETDFSFGMRSYLAAFEVPLLQELAVILTCFIVVGSSLPSINIVTRASPTPNVRAIQKAQMINLVIFFWILVKFIELIQAAIILPLLLDFRNGSIISNQDSFWEFLIIFSIASLAILVFVIISGYVNARKIVHKLGFLRYLLAIVVWFVLYLIVSQSLSVAITLILV